MSFPDDNKGYEHWLRHQCTVVEADLKEKCKRMKKSPFIFLRATYFRWAKRIEDICPKLAKAPAVLSVGDLYLENFGTWRDADGRLVWGINDFDEAAVMPYPFDLIRLATSARLLPGVEIRPHHLTTMLDGYCRGLKRPRATLLDEQERWMRPFVAAADHARDAFWTEIKELLCKEPRKEPPPDARRALEKRLPQGYEDLRFGSWVKGGGSLGRPRYVAVAAWNGGRIVREAKALIPSAWDWAHSHKNAKSRFQNLAEGHFRSPDPFLRAHGKWIIRRIAADSRKIDVGTDLDPKLFPALFDAMGFDLGAVHAADKNARRIEPDLQSRNPDWLHDAVQAAEEAVNNDYREWRG